MKINEILIAFVMSVFLVSANVGIIGAISFFIGLSLLIGMTKDNEKNDDIL